MHTDTLPVTPRRPEDRKLIKEINEEGMRSERVARALQTAAMAGLGILAAVALAAAAPMDTRAETREPIGTFTCSFYCPCRKCSGKWGYRTASGATCEEGTTVAVDRRVIPLGTKLYIEGLGYRIAQDTGVSGHWIDVFMEDHDECNRNGLQKHKVYIVKE